MKVSIIEYVNDLSSTRDMPMTSISFLLKLNKKHLKWPNNQLVTTGVVNTRLVQPYIAQDERNQTGLTD